MSFFDLNPSFEGNAKAWCVFDGSDGTILDSFGVDQVNRISPGLYTVFWETEFVDDAYTVLVSVESGATNVLAATLNTDSQAADSIEIRTYRLVSITLLDADRVHLAAFGRQ